jgi:hypothetical protein
MNKKLQNGDLDLATLRPLATHSYHQERFIELMLRAIEDNHEQVTSISVRLMNDLAYYEKGSYLYLKLNHFKRLVRSIPDNRLKKLHVSLGKVSTQDTKGTEDLY